MKYFEINVIFVGHILGIQCVLPHPFSWQYLLPYTIPLHFWSDFVFFAVFVNNCSVDVFCSFFFFNHFVNIFFCYGHDIGIAIWCVEIVIFENYVAT